MKKLGKKKFVLLMAVICCVLGIVTVFVFNLKVVNDIVETPPQPESVYNTNEKVIEDKNINNITFTDIECVFDGNNSLLSYTITNNTQKSVVLGEYEIIVKDKKGTILANLAPRLELELKPGESFSTGTSVNIDLTSAYEIELSLTSEDNEE